MGQSFDPWLLKDLLAGKRPEPKKRAPRGHVLGTVLGDQYERYMQAFVERFDGLCNMCGREITDHKCRFPLASVEWPDIKSYMSPERLAQEVPEGSSYVHRPKRPLPKLTTDAVERVRKVVVEQARRLSGVASAIPRKRKPGKRRKQKKEEPVSETPKAVALRLAKSRGMITPRALAHACGTPRMNLPAYRSTIKALAKAGHLRKVGDDAWAPPEPKKPEKVEPPAPPEPKKPEKAEPPKAKTNKKSDPEIEHYKSMRAKQAALAYLEVNDRICAADLARIQGRDPKRVIGPYVNSLNILVSQGQIIELSERGFYRRTTEAERAQKQRAKKRKVAREAQERGKALIKSKSRKASKPTVKPKAKTKPKPKPRKKRVRSRPILRDAPSIAPATSPFPAIAPMLAFNMRVHLNTIETALLSIARGGGGDIYSALDSLDELRRISRGAK